MAIEFGRRRFTTDEYQRMGRAGILREGDRIELIEGEIVTMTPIGAPHCAAVDRVARSLYRQVGDHAMGPGLVLCHLNSFEGFFDERRHRIWLRHIDRVTPRCLDDG